MSSRLKVSLASSEEGLYAIGSILTHKALWSSCVVWGTGTLCHDSLSGETLRVFPLNRSIPKLIKRLISPETTKADIRAVRGPLTREAILKEGGKCPEIYGDPAIIMPRLYTPKIGAKHKAGLILHHTQETPTTHVLAKGSSSKALSNFAPRELLSITQAKFLCKRLFRVLLKSFLRLADSTKFRLTELEMSS